MVKCDQKNISSLCCWTVSTSMSHPKVYNWFRWGSSSGRQAALCPERGRCTVADSLVRGCSGLGGATWALVPLFGMLLTVHHISNPKVTSHPEVETAIHAGVALWVAEAFICDANGLCAVERWIQQQSEVICLISHANQLKSSIKRDYKDKQQHIHVILIRTETVCFLINLLQFSSNVVSHAWRVFSNTDNIKTEAANLCRWWCYDKEKLRFDLI